MLCRRVFNQASGGSSSSGPPCPPTIGSGSSTGPVPPNAPQDYNRYSMGPGSTAGSGVGPPGPSSASGGYSGPGPRGYPPQVPPSGSPSPSGTPPSQQATQGPPGATPPAAPPQQPYQTSGPPPPQSDYYNRPDGYAGGPAAGYPPGPPGAPNKNMPPPAAQPRRHPDFVKDNPQAPFPGFNQQRPPNMYPGEPLHYPTNEVAHSIMSPVLGVLLIMIMIGFTTQLNKIDFRFFDQIENFEKSISGN